ncbi:MAG: hypothetical protein ABI383_11955 [Acidobacteriaceae bacterium]
MGNLHIMGHPLAHRLIEALALTGVHRFLIVSCASEPGPPPAEYKDGLGNFRGVPQWLQSNQAEFWQTAEEQLAIALEPPSGAVLVVRANAYFELGSATALAEFSALPFVHLQDSAGDLEVFWATAKAKAQGIDLLRAQMRQDSAPRMKAATYGNRLRSAADLRRLTADAFNLRLAFRPTGREIRPGVWAGEGTHIHRTARIVAPAYIGDHTKIRAAALITRGSSIEHHCEVDCGTVVQASNVLPFTYVGAGLELLHSVAGARHIANAAKGRTTEISDAKLLNEISGAPAVRLMGSAGRLASFLPTQMFRGIVDSFRKRLKAKAFPTEVSKSSMAGHLPGTVASRTVTVARDHGNE